MKPKKNPIKYSKQGKKVVMQVGILTIKSKKKSNKMRNLICNALDIKKLVFSKRGERTNHKKKKKKKGSNTKNP